MKILRGCIFLIAVCSTLVACNLAPNAVSPQTNNASVVGPAATRPAAQPTRAPTAPPTATVVRPPPVSPAAPVPTALPSSPTTQVAPTVIQAASPTPQPGRPSSGEIVFLRGGALFAYDVAAASERQIADGVRAFTATPDGRLLTLVRGTGRASELWLVNRDGSGLRQLTTNKRAEDTPVFAADGQTLAFAAVDGDGAAGYNWVDWTRWCRQSQIVVLDIASGQERALGAGCDPAFSPDGKRLAFATAPSGVEQASTPDNPMGIGNAIRLVNRQGQNGWNFATAGDPAKPDSGRLVFAPAWSADGKQIAYQRFVGYQSLTDILYTEVGDSFQGKGKKIAFGSGWLLAPRFAADNLTIAISDNDESNARGVGGYEQWSVDVVRLGGHQSIDLPDGSADLASAAVATLPRGQQAAWSPDGAALAVQLPSGWQADIAQDEPQFTDIKAGDVWRWQPGQQPAQKLITNVDFASPLLWLPGVS